MSLLIDILVDFGWCIIIVHRHVCVRAACGCERKSLRFFEADEEEAELMRKISSQDIFPNKICYKHGFSLILCFLIRSISTFLLLCYFFDQINFPILVSIFFSSLNKHEKSDIFLSNF